MPWIILINTNRTVDKKPISEYVGKNAIPRVDIDIKNNIDLKLLSIPYLSPIIPYIIPPTGFAIYESIIVMIVINVATNEFVVSGKNFLIKTGYKYINIMKSKNSRLPPTDEIYIVFLLIIY
ncbi:hypothetical protein JCM31447_28410 [Fluviispira sanaruensis]|uniref:Uncharacterized protein n=1 Tax=Fluviispira sanaruensis TaxID=2493639 RepID=A0A4V0P2T8_FLUSA|nr:hypothetical protein JCM31447_28410 [Fluviispira sanaruensis]